MPLIHFHHIGELTTEQKKALVAGMAKNVEETTGIPAQFVDIWLHPTPREDHAKAGLLLDDYIEQKK